MRERRKDRPDAGRLRPLSSQTTRDLQVAALHKVCDSPSSPTKIEISSGSISIAAPAMTTTAAVPATSAIIWNG
jgi:hypothetical protein